MPPLLLALTLAGPEPIPRPPYELQWSAPTSCPSPGEVNAKIATLLEGSHGPGVFVSAEAEVDALDNGFSLELSVSTRSGRRARTIQSTGCDELASATALLVAIAVDPDLSIVARGSSNEPKPKPKPQPEPQPRPQVVPETALSSASDPPRSDLQGRVLVEGGLSLGVLPAVAPTIRGVGGLRWPAWSLQVGVLHRFRSLVRGARGGAAELWTVSGELRGCRVPSLQGVWFPLCVGTEFGVIAGRGLEISNPTRGRAPLIALHARGGIVAALGEHMGISIAGALVIPVIRAGFEIEGLGELYRVGAIAFDGGVALNLFFP